MGINKIQLDEIKTKINEFKFAISNDEKKNKEYLVLKEKGNNLFHILKYDEAIEVYTEALKLHNLTDNEKSILYNNRANCNYKQYLIDNAPKILNEGLNDLKLAILCIIDWEQFMK